MAPVPSTYKAYVYERFGTVEDILALKDVATEPLPATHVRIQVHSAALNPIDFKVPELYGAVFTKVSPSAERPFRIGFDVAGVVVEVGADATGFRVGEQVYAMAGKDAFGTLAEYVAIDSKFVAPAPKTVDVDHAAGVPLASLTSYQALMNHAKLQAEETILILGGSTSTGIFAIQHAMALGARVVATTSTKNTSFVKSLGADQVIDYTAQKWAQELVAHSIDVVYDCSVEPQSWESDAQLVLKQNTGRFVTLKRGLSPSPAKFGASYHEVFTDPSGSDLALITQLIDNGRIKPVIDSVFPFSQTKEAFSRLKTGRAVGKVVVKVL